MKSFTLILLSLVVVTTSYSNEVVQHREDFNIDEMDDGVVHYWGRVASWSNWLKTGYQDLVGIDKNQIYTAYINNEALYPVVSPNLSLLEDVLGRDVGSVLYEDLQSRDDVEEERINEDGSVDILLSEQSATMYYSKIGLRMPIHIDQARVDLDTIINIFKEADRPHIHSNISAEFAHNILEPRHSGHAKIDSNSDSQFLFSTMKFEDYDCLSFLNIIAGFASLVGEKIERVYNEETGEEEPVLRVFSVSSLRRMNQSERESLSSVFGGVPDEVYKQEILSSSRLLKAGNNYWAFFDNGDGSTSLISFSALAITSQVAPTGLGVLLNGTSKTTIASTALSKISSGNE